MDSEKEPYVSEPSSFSSGEATAVAERAPKPQAASKRKPASLPPYNVVLTDDNDHTHEYVMEMLKAVFAHPAERGYRLAEEVNNRGRAIVLTTHKELAELKCDQIHSYGTDHRVATCKGSMTAYIEPAEG